MANLESITATFDDGTIVTTSGPFTPVIPPTPEQVEDVVVNDTDGTSETLVPEAPAPVEAAPVDSTAA